MRRILLLGNTGQLGWEAQRVLGCLGELVTLDYPDVDFTQPESLRSLVAEVKPAIIYNAAAYTAVDRAESDWERCRMINVVAPGCWLKRPANSAQCLYISQPITCLMERRARFMGKMMNLTR